MVSTSSNRTFIGRQTCVQLHLIQRIDMVSANIHRKSKELFMKKYSKAFGGLGCFPGNPMDITVKDGYVPKMFPIRRVAKNVIPKYKEAVDYLLDKESKKGVIEKIVGPVECLNNVVLSEKPNGKIRLVLDPKYLKQFTMREQ